MASSSSSSSTRKRYGLTMTHPPNICPIANKASREAAVAGWKQIPSLAEKHCVKVLSFDHFDPEHFIIAMFEADSIEAVRDFAMEAGLMAWNDLKINPVTPVSELMDNMDKAPPAILKEEDLAYFPSVQLHLCNDLFCFP